MSLQNNDQVDRGVGQSTREPEYPEDEKRRDVVGRSNTPAALRQVRRFAVLMGVLLRGVWDGYFSDRDFWG